MEKEKKFTEAQKFSVKLAFDKLEIKQEEVNKVNVEIGQLISMIAKDIGIPEEEGKNWWLNDKKDGLVFRILKAEKDKIASDN